MALKGKANEIGNFGEQLTLSSKICLYYDQAILVALFVVSMRPVERCNSKAMLR